MIKFFWVPEISCKYLTRYLNFYAKNTLFISILTFKKAAAVKTFSFFISTGTCGGLLRASSGELSSPGFPAAYPSSKTCVWEIESPFGTQLFINITHLNIEGMKNDCAYDYLRIGDREKLCGEHGQLAFINQKTPNYVHTDFTGRDARLRRSVIELSCRQKLVNCWDRVQPDLSLYKA